jgi:hypothetical protein
MMVGWRFPVVHCSRWFSISLGQRGFAALVAAAMAAAVSGCSGPKPPISVITAVSAKAIDQGDTDAVTATLTNDSTGQGVSWSLSGPGSLANATAASVTYKAPAPSLSPVQEATVTATSVADATKSASVHITVNPDPQIPSQTLASGTVGAAYIHAITVLGGTAPFQWSVYDGPIVTGWEVGGTVPDGLSLDASTGLITGTPTGAGTWYFEATVTDAAGRGGIDGFLSIEIEPSAAPGNPVPFLNQTLAPTSASPGVARLGLGVSGAGFVSGATVNWNGAPLPTTFVDSGHLAVVVPPANVAAAGTAAVTVVNPAPGGGRSNVVYFPVGNAETTVSFVAAPSSPLAFYLPFGVAVGDFNEDGKPDLAIAGGVKVEVLLGNGDGTFAAAPGAPFPVPSPPYDDFGSPYTGPGIAVGDFNHSGHQGLGVGLFQNEAAVILFGKGDGTFTFSDTLANTSGQSTMSLTAADFNADGNLDLAAVNSLDGGSPIALLGYGDGAFNAVEQNVQITGVSSAAGDFNGDGKLDLVIDGASILLGNGDGTFSQGASLSNSGTFVAVGDFNGDGKLDLAVCDSAKNTVTILIGDGMGNFAAGLPIPVGNQPDAIVAGDFNNDGKVDLAIANYGDGTVTLLLGNGDGTFTQAQGSPYAVGNGPGAIAAADFNGDGKLDLAVGNWTDNTVSILLQK